VRHAGGNGHPVTGLQFWYYPGTTDKSAATPLSLQPGTSQDDRHQAATRPGCRQDRVWHAGGNGHPVTGLQFWYYPGTADTPAATSLRLQPGQVICRQDRVRHASGNGHPVTGLQYLFD
jgi:hypothetical protein